MDIISRIRDFISLQGRSANSHLILSVCNKYRPAFVLYFSDREVFRCYKEEELVNFLDGFEKGVKHERNRNKTAQTGILPNDAQTS